MWKGQVLYIFGLRNTKLHLEIGSYNAEKIKCTLCIAFEIANNFHIFIECMYKCRTINTRKKYGNLRICSLRHDQHYGSIQNCVSKLINNQIAHSNCLLLQHHSCAVLNKMNE